MKRGLPKRFWPLVALVLTTSIPHDAPSQIPPRLEQSILTNGVFQFSLNGEADITYVIQSSPDLQTWISLVTNSDCGSVRSMAFAAPSGPAYYRAWARSPRLYGGAFSALAGVELKGNKVMVDSFNSGDPNYSTDGHYDPGKRKAGGDIYCQAGAVNIDDAFVYGKITTDPSTSLSIGQNGRVGDLNWAGPGIQPCWYAVHRFDLSWPEVTPPFSGGFPIPYNSASNTFYLGSGNYSTNGDFSLGNNQTLYVAGVVNLYVVGNFSIAAPGCALMIAPGATLHLYVGTVDGPGVTTRLTHVVNSGYGFSFLYYGLPSNTSLQLSFDSGGSYIGTVYAPETALDINVTGNTAVDFEGACVVRSVTASGPLNIHYDENLRRNGSTR